MILFPLHFVSSKKFLIVRKVNNVQNIFRRPESQGDRNAGSLRVRPFVSHKSTKVCVHGKEETKARPQE